MDDLAMDHPELDEFFDRGGGTLPPEVRAHVARCGQCAAEVAALAELRRRARELPTGVKPGRDLWQGIARRIGAVPSGQEGQLARPADRAAQSAAPGTVLPLRRPRAGAARWREMWGWMAAAAVVLVMITSGATAYLTRGPVAAAAPIASSAGGGMADRPVGLAAFAASAPEYRSTVEALEAELAARRERLSPETIRIVEQNLAIIDGAIDEARRALAADPTSAELPLLLSGVYRQKVELLREVVALTARS